MNPLISVIIPAHNDASTIAVAITSILNQIYKSIEVIVVDDNSSDETAAVVQSFADVRYMALPIDDPHRFNHRGVNINAGWMARNFGIDHARGEWITFQDADDASLLNRIEVQYELAKRYSSNHVCTGWQRFDESLLGTTLDVDPYLNSYPEVIVGAEELTALAEQTRGRGTVLLGSLHRFVPFPLKRRLRFFFPDWTPYPFAGNSPLVHRDVFKRVRFRPRDKRVWPSDRGRGADRDFNFQVALTFQNSLCVNIPLYLWRVEKQNPSVPAV